MHIEFDITVSVTQEFIDYQFMDYEEAVSYTHLTLPTTP